MKVIFLDIDGVLNSTRSTVAFNHRERRTKPRDSDSSVAYFYKQTMKTLDYVAVSLINRAVEETGAKLVLSSTHRKHFIDKETHEYLLEDIALYLKALGLTGEVIGATPNSGGHRGKEIKEWLDKNPQVNRYVIIDDDSDMLDEQREFFVHSENKDGMSLKNFKEMISILTGSIFEE